MKTMAQKKNWLGILVIVLVCGISVLVTGCGQKGGTVTFINDTGNDGSMGVNYCTVGIAVSTTGTPNAPFVLQTVVAGGQISEFLDEDGYYVVSAGFQNSSGTYTKTGRLTGGETVTLKWSERGSKW